MKDPVTVRLSSQSSPAGHEAKARCARIVIG